MIEIKPALKGFSRNPLPKESRWGKLRLEKNERLGSFGKRVLDHALSQINEEMLTSYPELHHLYEKLSSSLDLPKEKLLLTNGSESGIRLIFSTYVSEGEEVALMSPSFEMTELYAKLAGAKIVRTDFDANFNFPIEKFIESICPQTKVASLTHPSDPFGYELREEDFFLIQKKCEETQTLLHIDESYVEFSGKSFVRDVSNFKNLVVTRTFSNAFGLSGICLGYLSGNEGSIEALRLTQPPHEVSSIAAFLGEYMLDHPQILESYLAEIKQGREYLCQQLKQLGLSFHCRGGNFVLIQLKQSPEGIVNQLRKNKILVAGPLEFSLVKNWIRVTLGPLNEMKQFFDELQIAVKKYSSSW